MSLYVEKGGVFGWILSHARQWTVLHITESVICRVEQLATDKEINEMLDGEMISE